MLAQYVFIYPSKQNSLLRFSHTLQLNKNHNITQEKVLTRQIGLLPTQGFGPYAKTRGGIIVVRA